MMMICISIFSPLSVVQQDSFELPRGDASRDGDIEMGAQVPMNSADLGLEGFFKQV